MVTSPHTLATKAGLKILRGGGNAIEAAIAMASAIAVTYPHFAGLGGDSVWLIADADGRTTSLLGIGQAAARLPAYAGTIPLRGAGSMLTSACTVDSWHQAYRFSAHNWGGRAAFSSLLDDAIGFAENGFPTSRSETFWSEYRRSESSSWAGFSRNFERSGARRQMNDVFVQADLAGSLKRIARNGARDFYEGELAAQLATGLAACGSPLTASDLRDTVAREAPPIALDYRGITLLAPPPPTQGVSTLSIMGVLREFELRAAREGSTDDYHLCIEAVKQAFLDRPGIADPDFVHQNLDLWLSREHLARKAAAISMTAALPWPPDFMTGDTVYLGAVDGQGRCASVLQSLYFDWGSGVVVGDTGILWQNRGAAFSLDACSPNVLAPGKRPFYTLNPGIALKAGKPHLVYGTQGADGQPQTLAKVLTRLLDYDLDPLQALSRPRFLVGKTFSDSSDSVKLEDSAGRKTLEALRGRGHDVGFIPTNSPLAGQAGAIVIHDDGHIEGAHDPRSDGEALGV